MSVLIKEKPLLVPTKITYYFKIEPEFVKKHNLGSDIMYYNPDCNQWNSPLYQWQLYKERNKAPGT